MIAKSKEYLQAYKTTSTNGFISVIIQFLRPQLTDDKFDEKLDTTPHILAFKNGIINLKTKQFREGLLSTDFLTDTIPYDYEPCDITKKETLKGYLKKILNNNNEHLDYFLSLLGFSFIGMPHLEKSIYFMIDKTENGCGDNGKTFFFDILLTLMPNYVYQTKASLIETKNTKIHKQFAMMKGKRLIYLEELPKEKDTNAEIMKVIGDGKKYENEVMFGTSESIIINFKMFALSNHIPNIDPNENAVYNRYKQVSFNSHFDRTGNRVEEDPSKLLFIADETLGDTIKTQYYNEVFALMIEYANKYYMNKIPKIPIQFVADTQETKYTNDKFACWFDEHCVKEIDGKIALKLLMSESEMNEIKVKEGMKRKGYKYNKDLSGMGKDCWNKGYKGGYEGVSIISNISNDVDAETSHN